MASQWYLRSSEGIDATLSMLGIVALFPSALSGGLLYPNPLILNGWVENDFWKLPHPRLNPQGDHGKRTPHVISYHEVFANRL